MRILTVYIFLIFSFQSFSQNKAEIEADYEMQGYFKNYENFSIDSLKNQGFQFIKEDDRGFGELLFERKRDNGISEKIYRVLINYVSDRYTKYKEYKVHSFSKNDSIIGLINYDKYREKTNYYFDFEKLKNYLEYHNEFYKSELTTSDFVNQVLADHVYGYYCGFAPVSYDVPRYNDLIFDDKRNISEFRNWLKSFNPELQTYGIDAIEYLEKNKGLKLTELDKKLISNIKKRNSILNTCSGCLGIYEKANGN
ncbi:hypothetical protein ACU8DI_14770 [Psychroserpens sp. BH13MA-6]